MKEFLVVDGYNIIYAWPEFENLKESGLEHARYKLVSILANYSYLSGQKTFVVFDAHQVKNSVERTDIIDSVDVIFTKQGETADAYIESLVGRLFNEGIIYVATSDRAEQGIVFGKGAYRLTPGELRDQIDRARKEIQEHYTKTLPSESYLENHLLDQVRSKFERWRRGKK